MAVVHDLVVNAARDVDVENSAGIGTTLKIRLPQGRAITARCFTCVVNQWLKRTAPGRFC